MRILKEEVSGDGLEKHLGERVILICAGYFYEGKLIGVNYTDVVLGDPHIVYGTGKWADKDYSAIEKLIHADEWFVKIASIESYGRSKKS